MHAQKKGDSLAQQVEHRPFKAGVLGSNPRRITEQIQNGKMVKWQYPHRIPILPFCILPSYIFPELFRHKVNAGKMLSITTYCKYNSNSDAFFDIIGNAGL